MTKKAFKNEEPVSKRQAPHAKEAVGDSKNWQFKGEGKGGSLGISVGSNSTVTADTGNVIPPAPKANTRENVQKLFDTGYFKYPEKPFWDDRIIWDVDRGTLC